MKDFMFWTVPVVGSVTAAYITGDFWAWILAIVVCLFIYAAAHEALTTGSEPPPPSDLEDVNSRLNLLYRLLDECPKYGENAAEYQHRKNIQGEIADMMRIKASLRR